TPQQAVPLPKGKVQMPRSGTIIKIANFSPNQQIFQLPLLLQQRFDIPGQLRDRNQSLLIHFPLPLRANSAPSSATPQALSAEKAGWAKYRSCPINCSRRKRLDIT